MFLAFGLVMEFPILLVGLSRVGILTSERLRRSRRMRDPRHRDLLGRRHARRRPRQPVRARRHDVPAVRADRPVHPAQRPVNAAAPTPGARATPWTEPAVVIVSGLSGGGKTAAAKLFEDLGYTVVDNLPGELLPDLAELVSSDRERFARVAIVLDVRSGDATLALARDARRARGPRDPAAGRLPRGARRRPDPAVQRDAPPSPARRRARHRQLDRRGAALPGRRSAAEADVVLDTSDLSLRQLRERLFAQLATTVRPDQLAIQLISFGFKYGVPLEADLVFDVRFMQNPYYIAGAAAAVRADRRGPRVRPRPAGRAPVPRLPRRVPRLRRSRPTSPRARPA